MYVCVYVCMYVCMYVCVRHAYVLCHIRVPAKAVGRNEMPFGRDTCMVSSNVVLDKGPAFPREGKLWGRNPQFAAMPLIAKLLWPLLQYELEIWGRAQREAARGVRKQALINF